MNRYEKYRKKIFDSDLGKYRSYMDFAEDYGFSFADKMLKKQEEKSSVEGKQDLKVLNFSAKKNEHKAHPIEGQFLPLEYERFFGNDGLMKALANKTMLYLILLKNKVDWDKNEKLNLFQEYFKKRNLIVASISRAKLGKMLGVHTRTITNWLNQLQQDGLIKVERIACDEDDDRRHKYNVIILGKVMEDGTYRYYFDEK